MAQCEQLTFLIHRAVVYLHSDKRNKRHINQMKQVLARRPDFLINSLKSKPNNKLVSALCAFISQYGLYVLLCLRLFLRP